MKPHHYSNPGPELRFIRLKLGLSLRDVHAMSLEVAKKHSSRFFVIPPTCLHAIEAKHVAPSIHRLYTLAVVYGCTVSDLLCLYGIQIQPVVSDLVN